MNQLSLGCIADDFTGATDLASLLQQSGASVIQTIGIPGQQNLPDCDVLVIALNSRMSAREEAISESLQAWEWLKKQGITRCFFKYCSTFDSTPEGNIGPVADALLAACGGSLAIACPSFPKNGRTVYQGNLFVDDKPLNESSMRHHPLTPMTDANLVRVLGAQSDGDVGLVPWVTVNAGADDVVAALAAAESRGERLIIVDALCDHDLDILGAAVRNHALVTGGSAMGAAWARALMDCAPDASDPASEVQMSLPQGHAVVLAGSCSEVTLEQIACARQSIPARRLDVDDILASRFDFDAALEWVAGRLDDGPVMLHSSESAERRAAREGPASSGRAIERTFAKLAMGLHDLGVRRFVVAGGETSAAVVKSLGVNWLQIGQVIAPGVPWTVSGGDLPIALALKSGNFGTADFFLRALEVADGVSR